MKKHTNYELSKQLKNRIKKRQNSNEQKYNQKQERLNNNEREKLILNQFKGILKKHKNTEKRMPKRSGVDKFINYFAFIPSGLYDKQYTYAIQNEWKCH